MKQLISTVTLFIIINSLSLAKPIEVITSFSILEDIARKVGGEQVNVSSVIKANQNAHTFEPKPHDIIQISQADIFIINGLNFEGWITRTIEPSGFTGLLINSSKDIIPISLNMNHKEHDNHGDNHDHGDDDPHIWQSPLNVSIMAKNIRDGLINIDPEHQETYENNYQTYLEELQSLDDWAKKQISSLPQENLHFLILHDSFRYLSKDYGISFHPIMKANLMSEPSAKEMANIMNMIKANHIRVVFFENIETSRFLNTIMTDLKLTSGGVLYSDALPADKNRANYIDMFKANIEAIVNASKAQND